MRAHELFENNNELRIKVLVWLISKGISEKDAPAYLDHVGVENLSKEMNAEREKQEEILRKLKVASIKNLQFQNAKRDNPEYVSYNIVNSNTKTVMINNQEVGTITKDGNKWSGIINQHKVGPDSIMKFQDEIDMITFGSESNESI